MITVEVIHCARPRALSHAVPAVGADRVLRIDAAGDHPDVEVVAGAPVTVGAGAQARGRHLVHLRPRARLLHREQTTRLLPRTLQLLQYTDS